MKTPRVFIVPVLFVLSTCFFAGCLSAPKNEVGQYGAEGNDTTALNLTKDPNVGDLYVTHVNGEATGAYITENKSFLSVLSGGPSFNSKYINPLYVKLDGKPITFTVLCPVVTGHNATTLPIIKYKTTELRLTKLSDLKAGDVLTLRWMKETGTLAFMDATGNLVQQTIPTFN